MKLIRTNQTKNKRTILNKSGMSEKSIKKEWGPERIVGEVKINSIEDFVETLKLWLGAINVDYWEEKYPELETKYNISGRLEINKKYKQRRITRNVRQTRKIKIYILGDREKWETSE